MIIQGRYQIEEELGEGGMGTVYKGLDTQSNQPVAIKQLKPELLSDDMLERFQREGQALRDLNHPNIVKMLDAVEDDGNHYLIMEYVSGGNLRELLAQRQLEIQEVVQLAIDLADALTRAHRLDIIHRDLKPANVLIAEDGTPRLTDFGVAFIADRERVTGANAIVGTIDYLAPESFSDNNRIDTKTDIWAFGVLLFEMLTGQRPFVGDSVARVIMSIVSDPVPDIEELRRDMPVALADLLYRMLEKDPDQRVPSVRIVGADLEAILQGRSNQRQSVERFATPTPNHFIRTKHNLPAQTSAFVGREAELAELIGLFNRPDVRLVTILAPGGMGKTRISLELARRYVEENLHVGATQTGFDNGVYFIELAPITDPDAILYAVTSVIGFQYQDNERSHKQQLLDFLQPQKILFVFDNFEHVLEGAGIVGEILKAAPNIRIVATSRQRLGQSDESLFHLSGMEFPKWETPADAMDYAAVKLFMNSAKRAKPDFELTSDNLPFVARICRLVQGMPLGILLAASWLGMLTLEEIAAEIQKDMDFLASEAGGELPSRQQSIRTVMVYSWQMMNETEQAVFMKLAVFKGGFTREAAQAVAGANLRVLMALVNKSLLRRDAESGRYEIHELLRQYAEEQLQEANLLAEAHYSHAKYFAEFMNNRWDGLGFSSPEALQEIHPETENLRLGWQYLLNHFEADLYKLLMPCYTELMRGLPNIKENIDLIESYIPVLKASQNPQAVHILANTQLSLAIIYSGTDLTSFEKYVMEAMNFYTKNPDSYEYLIALGYWAILLWQKKQFDESLKQVEKNFQIFKERDFSVGFFWINWFYAAYYAEVTGDYEKVLSHAEAGLAIARQEGYSTLNTQHLLSIQATIYAEYGEYDKAIEILNQAKEDAIHWNGVYAISQHLGSLASIYAKMGNIDKAIATIVEIIVWHQRIARDWQMLGAIYDNVFQAIAYGVLDLERGIEYISMVYHHPESIPIYRQIIDERLPEVKDKLSDEDFAAAWERGKALNLQKVVADILSTFTEDET